MFIIFQVYLSLSSDQENSALEHYFQLVIVFCVEEKPPTENTKPPTKTRNLQQKTRNLQQVL